MSGLRELEGETAIVTGASRGLGRAIALELGSAGCFVVVGYHVRDRDAAETVEAIRASGGEATSVALDVREPETVERVVGEVMAKRGRVDVLINNAGLTSGSAFAMADRAEWDDVMRVNVDGAVHCCRAVARPMMRSERGAIVNVGSVASLRARAGLSAYATSKGALIALTRALATELAPHGIRVNAVVPGLIATGMSERLDRSTRETRTRAIPMGRMGTGQEVARAVRFLVSPSASYVTGHALVVDGGLAL